MTSAGKVSYLRLFLAASVVALIVPLASGQDPPTWSLVVVSPSSVVAAAPEEHVVWLGIKNLSSSWRLVCVGKFVSYLVQTPNETPAVEGTASPHSCEVTDSFNIVLPSETMFYPLKIESKGWSDRSKIKIEVGVTSRDTRDVNVQTNLEWEGTLATIREATRSRGLGAP
jgi:hypothetical protein